MDQAPDTLFFFLVLFLDFRFSLFTDLFSQMARRLKLPRRISILIMWAVRRSV